jgi:hypothetical protein
MLKKDITESFYRDSYFFGDHGLRKHKLVYSCVGVWQSCWNSPADWFRIIIDSGIKILPTALSEIS